MNAIIELSEPYNWCDRRCERCPLAASCAVATAPPRDLHELFAEAAELVEALCREQGIDPDERVEREPPSIDRRVLERAAYAWVSALATLERHVADVPLRATFVAGKVARIAGYADELDDAVWAMDSIPNLLVLERVLDAVSADVASAGPGAPVAAVTRFRERDVTLRGLLAPHLATISAADRAVLAALTAAGRAPSPFVTTAPSPPDRGPRAARG